MQGFLTKHRDVSMIIAIAKMELFVTLVGSFQSLNNFTKKPKIGAMGVLHVPLEYYILKFVQVIKLSLQNSSLQLF